MKLPKITSVRALGKYWLFVRFSDDSEGEYDVSHLAGKGVFERWDSDDNFSKVFINPDSGSITWPGDLDIDTINVYCNINGFDIEKYLNANQYHAAH